MDEQLVPDTITIRDGRLGVVDTQSEIIDRLLVDENFDALADNDGNLITE